MADDITSIETRLWVLETLVAFLFAAQHLQTPDPAAALVRVRSLLLERADVRPPPGAELEQQAALVQLERTVERIVELQQLLPRRLVD